MIDCKVCPVCKLSHFNDYELCAYCAAERQRELEYRLQVDDGAASLAIVAGWAMLGFQKMKGRVWWVL